MVSTYKLFILFLFILPAARYLDVLIDLPLHILFIIFLTYSILNNIRCGSNLQIENESVLVYSAY